MPQGAGQTVGDDELGSHHLKNSQELHPITALEKIQSAMVRTQTVPPAPRHNTAQYVSTLLDSLQRGSPHDEEPFVAGTWIYDVADRIDNAPVLETAVCAFGHHLLGKMHHDCQAIAQSRSVYGTSLKLLQQSLIHLQRWKASETLGASLILCFYEVRTAYICFHPC